MVHRRKKTGRIAWGIALLVLAAALAWFNLIGPAMRPAETAELTEAAVTEAPQAAEILSESANTPESAEEDFSSTKPVGTDVGSQLPDFSTELLSGEMFHLADFRGRVVIINFWATTCAPCIEELPYYEQLKVNHPDVEILAIHNRAGAKKAGAFLADRDWTHLDFALDSREKGLLPLLNAADAIPQTIILNRRGEVTYNAQASLTLEKLEILYQQAFED